MRVPQGDATVGIVLVSHGTGGEALLRAAESIVGPLPATATVAVAQQDPFDEVLQRVSAACDKVDSGLGVLILVDLHGASPFHACLAMMDGTRPAEILCGMNLPMLLKLATVDRHALRPTELADILREVGKRSIRLGSELTGKVVLEEPR